jgi:DNA-directed RNA polymerase subunit omega
MGWFTPHRTFATLFATLAHPNRELSQSMARITVEDCLVQENNRFALVQLASKRTKQLLQGSTVQGSAAQTAAKKNKAVVTALREIADGKVRFMTPEELAEFQELQRQEAEAAAAAAEAERQRRTEMSAGIFGVGGETRSPSFLRDSLMATGPAAAGDDGDDDDEE